METVIKYLLYDNYTIVEMDGKNIIEPYSQTLSFLTDSLMSLNDF